MICDECQAPVIEVRGEVVCSRCGLVLSYEPPLLPPRMDDMECLTYCTIGSRNERSHTRYHRKLHIYQRNSSMGKLNYLRRWCQEIHLSPMLTYSVIYQYHKHPEWFTTHLLGIAMTLYTVERWPYLKVKNLIMPHSTRIHYLYTEIAKKMTAGKQSHPVRTVKSYIYAYILILQPHSKINLSGIDYNAIPLPVNCQLAQNRMIAATKLAMVCVDLPITVIADLLPVDLSSFYRYMKPYCGVSRPERYRFATQIGAIK